MAFGDAHNGDVVIVLVTPGAGYQPTQRRGPPLLRGVRGHEGVAGHEAPLHDRLGGLCRQSRVGAAKLVDGSGGQYPRRAADGLMVDDRVGGQPVDPPLDGASQLVDSGVGVGRHDGSTRST